MRKNDEIENFLCLELAMVFLPAFTSFLFSCMLLRALTMVVTEEFL